MKKNILVISIITVFIIMLGLNSHVYADRNLGELYNQVNNMLGNSGSMFIEYNKINEFITGCTDDELNAIVNCTGEIRKFFEGISITAPNGSTYSLVAIANDEKIRRATANNGQTGSDVNKDNEKAQQKAEEIKQAYTQIGSNVANASIADLKKISNMINELVKLDGTVGQHYQSVSDIKNKVVAELEKRNESSGSIDDIAQNTLGTELPDRVGSKPLDTLLGYNPGNKTSPDEIIGEAKNFLDIGKNNQDAIMVNGDNVQKGSNMLFNVLFAVAIAAAILIGMYIGIKFMMSSAEDKATIKESLLPYFAGVIIMFSAFSIWKLILILLQGIDNI